MEVLSFIPRTQINHDPLGRSLLMAAKWLLFGFLVLLPLLMLPGIASLTAVKAFTGVYVMLVVAVLTSMALLRNGRLAFERPWLLLAWGGVMLSGVIAGLLAPSTKTAFLGDSLEIHTVGFLLILGAVMGAMQLFQSSKRLVGYLMMSLVAVAGIITLFHVLRAVIGSSVLSLGFMGSAVDTTLGGFNDLGLYVGLMVIVSLIAMVQLSFSRLLMIATGVFVGLSLFVLAVVNFYMVWVIVALFALLMLMYSLTKGRMGDGKGTAPSMGTITIIGLTFFVATIFVVGGSSLATKLSTYTGVSYLEVRPSLEATIDIIKGVYRHDAVVGSGPNQFADAWSLYKNPSINNTLFWDTRFDAGNGYVTTWFATAGVLGAIAWMIFFGLFIVEGWRSLVRPRTQDRFWYFIGTTTFVSAIFIWGFALFYVPGAVLLIIGAAMTGLFLVASAELRHIERRSIELLNNSKTGLVLIGGVMIVIIGVIATGYQVTQQFFAHMSFIDAVEAANSGKSIDDVAALVLKAYQYYPSDTYVRELSKSYLGEMNNVLAQNTSTNEQIQQQFSTYARMAVETAGAATMLRNENAENWRVLGDIYATLSVTGVAEAETAAEKAYTQAMTYDPQNPYYYVTLAGIAARTEGQKDKARQLINDALGRKANYTDALLLSTQIDVSDGNLDKAIETTRSLIVIEPNNAGRYYQLGVLLSADKKIEAAVDAFTAAVTINPQYANARYLRALSYMELDKRDDAVADLQVVQGLNPDNAEIATMISQIKDGTFVLPSAQSTSTSPVVSEPTVDATNPQSTADDVSESNLLTPVNTVPQPTEESESVAE